MYFFIFAWTFCTVAYRNNPFYVCVYLQPVQVSWRRTCKSFECNVADSNNIFKCRFRWYCTKYVLWTWYCRQYRNNGECCSLATRTCLYIHKQNICTISIYVYLYNLQELAINRNIYVDILSSSKFILAVFDWPFLYSPFLSKKFHIKAT